MYIPAEAMPCNKVVSSKVGTLVFWFRAQSSSGQMRGVTRGLRMGKLTEAQFDSQSWSVYPWHWLHVASKNELCAQNGDTLLVSVWWHDEEEEKIFFTKEMEGYAWHNLGTLWNNEIVQQGGPGRWSYYVAQTLDRIGGRSSLPTLQIETLRTFWCSSSRGGRKSGVPFEVFQRCNDLPPYGSVCRARLKWRKNEDLEEDCRTLETQGDRDMILPHYNPYKLTTAAAA